MKEKEVENDPDFLGNHKISYRNLSCSCLSVHSKHEVILGILWLIIDSITILIASSRWSP